MLCQPHGQCLHNKLLLFYVQEPHGCKEAALVDLCSDDDGVINLCSEDEYCY